MAAQTLAEGACARVTADNRDPAMAEIQQSLRRQSACFTIVAYDVVEARIQHGPRHEDERRHGNMSRSKLLLRGGDCRRHDDAVGVVFRHRPDEIGLSLAGFVGVAQKNGPAGLRQLLFQRCEQGTEERIGDIIEDNANGVGLGRAKARCAAGVDVSIFRQGGLDAISRVQRDPLVAAHGERHGGRGDTELLGDVTESGSGQSCRLDGPVCLHSSNQRHARPGGLTQTPGTCHARLFRGDPPSIRRSAPSGGSSGIGQGSTVFAFRGGDKRECSSRVACRSWRGCGAGREAGEQGRKHHPTLPGPHRDEGECGDRKP